MRTAKHAVVDHDCYGQVMCVKCGFGDNDEELLLCDKCDRGYHMLCVRPIVVRVPMGPWFCPSCSDQRPLKSMDFDFDFVSMWKLAIDMDIEP